MFDEGGVPAGGRPARFGPEREPVFAQKGQLCLPSTMWGATSFPLWLQQPLKRSVCTLLGEWKL